MGGNQSSNATQLGYSQIPAVPFGFPYFALTFSAPDKLKVVNGNEQILAIIRETLQQLWPAIEGEVNVMGVDVFQIADTPFLTSNREQAVRSKRLASGLLATFLVRGWQLVLSTDLSRTGDLTTWIFQWNHSPQQGLAGPLVCGLSLSSTDSLQLVNAPQYLHGVLAQICQPLVQKEQTLSDTEYELKLKGNPWESGDFNQGVSARRLLLQIIKGFDQQRFSFIGTANLKGTADTLFFKQEPEVHSEQGEYWMLSLNKNDRIRLVDAPTEVIHVVGQVLQEYWYQGLQGRQEFPEVGCYEYKLRGCPWSTSGDEATQARLIITVIMQTLLTKGWAVLSALDISRRPNDKGVLIFRRCAPTSAAQFCLSPSDSNCLRVINGSQEVVQLVRNVISRSWLPGVVSEGPITSGYQWKLKGELWDVDGGVDCSLARYMLCNLLEELFTRGWRVITSMDVSSRFVHRKNLPDYPLDVHCWFFAQTGDSSSSLQAYSSVQVDAAPRLPTNFLSVNRVRILRTLKSREFIWTTVLLLLMLLLTIYFLHKFLKF